MPAKLTSKGQTTSSKAIRDHLHLVEGDKVGFVIEDVSELKGILKAQTQGKVISLEEMDRATLVGGSDA